ncbi:MAG: hypothetical protein ACRDRM_04310, partial [Pseudonocardiaceae bacterium]
RFLALLSVARVETEPGWTRPLLNIEVQLWIREVTRMLRIVAPAPGSPGGTTAVRTRTSGCCPPCTAGCAGVPGGRRSRPNSANRWTATR